MRAKLFLLTIILTLSLVNAAQESSNAVEILCFLFFSLFLGVVVTYLLSRYVSNLPYTVVVFVIGVIFGVAHVINPTLIESIDIWNSISPDLILYVRMLYILDFPRILN